jgi:hypothetical protein
MGDLQWIVVDGDVDAPGWIAADRDSRKVPCPRKPRAAVGGRKQCGGDCRSPMATS